MNLTETGRHIVARAKSDSAPLRVLLVQHCADCTGSTVSGHMIAKAFRNRGWIVDVAFGFDGPYASRYADVGCRVHTLAHKNWLRGGNFVRSARRLASEWRTAKRFVGLIRQVAPDIVYLNSMVSLAAAIGARRCRVPCVWHLRELFDDIGGEMLVPACGGRALVRLLLRRLAHRQVAISRAVAENVVGAVDARVNIIPNAAPAEFFDLEADSITCRRQFGLPPDVPVIGVPGNLRPVKGHPFFFAAAAEVVRSFPNCSFAVTGSGEPTYVASLRQQVSALGLSERTIFLGTVEDMSRFYRACDIVCVPSRSESFGRTVVEAFAVGTPVVATAAGGMCETIENGRTGFLVPFGDAATLAGKLVQLLEDESLRQQFASAARAVATDRYHELAYQRRILEIVTSVSQSS